MHRDQQPIQGVEIKSIKGHIAWFLICGIFFEIKSFYTHKNDVYYRLHIVIWKRGIQMLRYAYFLSPFNRYHV